MVTRSLNDNYCNFIFSDVLGWNPDFYISTSTPTIGVAGSTSLLMPFNGSLLIDNSTSGYNRTIINSQLHKQRVGDGTTAYPNDTTLYNYIKGFHPFLFNGDKEPYEGVSIAILKKDGTWDLVQSYDFYVTGISLNMSDWTFHYDNEQYARTTDGYLRARYSIKKHNSSGGVEYKFTYFVVDYLPQKINLTYAFVNPSLQNDVVAQSDNNIVRLYLSNTEGSDRIVIEQLRSGSRVPSKTEITNFKQGWYETTLSKTSTFTTVSYNKNGATRGTPITISPSAISSTKFRLSDNYINIEVQGLELNGLQYKITSINTQLPTDICGTTNGIVDVSDLIPGWYILTVYDNNTGFFKSFKFEKQ